MIIDSALQYVISGPVRGGLSHPPRYGPGIACGARPRASLAAASVMRQQGYVRDTWHSTVHE